MPGDDQAPKISHITSDRAGEWLGDAMRCDAMQLVVKNSRPRGDSRGVFVKAADAYLFHSKSNT